jgi:hypothetical protein
MTNSIVYDNEGIRKSNKLVKGWIVIARIKIKMHLAIQ